MSELILRQPDLVTVTWEPDIPAIVIKWETLYREDTGVRDALEACFDYVRKNAVANWIADTSEARAGLSDADAKWAEESFNKTIASLGLQEFILVNTLSPGGESSGIEEWLAAARKEIGDALRMRLAASMTEARALLSEGPHS